MSDFVFLNSKMVWLMLLVAAFVVLHFYRERKRRQDLDGFTKGHTRLVILRWPQLVFICLSIFFLVFALMQPAWNKKPKTLLKEGRDLVFILDVSNSMLAEDVIPNRLERSKIAISECIDTLENHRVGLVVFSGSATIKCPLTLDYDFFNSMLTKVGPNSAAQGGTRIADAILKTSDKLFSDSRKGYKDIILISDGGDQGKSLTKAIEILNEQSIKLIVIGIGDERNGARIPAGEGFMTYKGKEVWTKLDSAQLQTLVKECKKGAYLPAGTAQIDLGRIYEQLTANDENMEMGEQRIMVYKEEYPMFILIAFICLVLSLLPDIQLKKAQTATAALMIFTCMASADVGRDAETAMVEKNYLKATSLYLQLVSDHPTLENHFKLASAQFRNKSFEESSTTFRQILDMNISIQQRVKTMYNLATSQLKFAEAAEEPGQGLYEVNKSLVNFRKVILQKPDFADAAINFEFAKKLRKEIQDAIEEQRKQQEEMQQALDGIRKDLEKLVNDQTDNLTQTNNSESLIENLIKKEEQIKADTITVQGKIKALKAKHFKEPDEEHSPFKPSQDSLNKARVSEDQAIEALKLTRKDSIPFEQDALNYLKEALEQFPQDPNQQQDEGESDDSEEGDEEYDEEYEEESEEEGEGDYGEPLDTEKIDLENQKIPPPTDNYEDILKREQQIQDVRQQNASDKKRPSVEKDW